MTTTGTTAYNPLVHRLGLKPADPFAKQLWLPNYLDAAALPPAPPARMWLEYANTWTPIFLNTTLQTCVLAMMGHAVATWTGDASAGKASAILPDSTILSAYSAWGGYVLGNPATDLGLDVNQALAEFQVNGLGGHKIVATAFFLSHQIPMLRTAVNIFGGVGTRFGLPISAQSQIGGIWDVPPGGPTGTGALNSWGLHETYTAGYDGQFFYMATWGSIQKCTVAFMSTYGIGVDVMVSRDWLTRSGRSPSGVNLQQMVADARLLR